VFLRAHLQAHGIVLAGGDRPQVDILEHDLWIVATQDCDLDGMDPADDVDSVELRPVFNDDPPPTLGIRSRKLRLVRGEPYYLHAESRRAMVSPASLLTIHRADPDCREEWLDDARLTALKTWLGKRYDRPAVPPDFVPLARAIASAVNENRRNRAVDDVRDIFAQFGETDPVTVALFAVIEDDGDRDAVLTWLADVARGVPADLGIVDTIEVGTTAEISFSVVENSFAVDASDITWRGNAPRGAH
jgi:hypothetical protein